ncbi:MAG: helix-turn-helix transcriptional regulator [Bacteroidales bacterium]|nr:helix-turn-helix transcriptional regulator [Bacteroidales bacterium]
MVERINTLLKAKNITARQFAEEIGIQPSGMSHILSGRNNPSLEFVMKVMKRWPEININWLMFGKGEMYVTQSSSVPMEQVDKADGSETTQVEATDYDLFSQPPLDIADQPLQKQQKVENNTDFQQVENQPPVQDQHQPNPMPPIVEQMPVTQPVSEYKEEFPSQKTLLHENYTESEHKPEARVQQTLPKKKIVKMVVLYDDHTFAEYFPE